VTAFSDKIEIRHLINSGDYFDAYRATDISLDRPVFLKVAKASNKSVAPMVVEAHVRTWQALARLRVDGMPAILDIGSNHGRRYLVTEWITGVSLRALVDAGPAVFTQPAELLVTILKQGLAILADLHGQGFVHGDIGPGNILIGTRSGNLKVHMVDPFPAEDLRDPADPNSRLIFGTPSFMAPEIRGGGPASIQADLFALGKVIAEAAHRLNTGTPVLVETLIAERPKDRPASAEQALLALASAFAPRTEPDKFRAPGGDARPSDRAARAGWEARTGAGRPANAPVPLPRASAATPSNTWSEASTVVSAIDAPRSDWTEASVAVSVPVPPASEAPAVPADFSIMAPSSNRRCGAAV
jgi:serine/threonine protein kinase